MRLKKAVADAVSCLFGRKTFDSIVSDMQAKVQDLRALAQNKRLERDEKYNEASRLAAEGAEADHEARRCDEVANKIAALIK